MYHREQTKCRQEERKEERESASEEEQERKKEKGGGRKEAENKPSHFARWWRRAMSRRQILDEVIMEREHTLCTSSAFEVGQKHIRIEQGKHRQQHHAPQESPNVTGSYE